MHKITASYSGDETFLTQQVTGTEAGGQGGYSNQTHLISQSVKKGETGDLHRVGGSVPGRNADRQRNV